MFYLLRDDTLLHICKTPEAVVSEVNKALANFRTYGGLNFRDEGVYFLAYYGNLATNLKVKWDEKEDKEAFEKAVVVNF